MAKRTRPGGSIMDQLEAGLAELNDVLQGKREVRKVPVTVQAPGVYSAEDMRSLRNDLNMSQAEFAQLLEVSPKTVQAWEHGLRTPGPMIRTFLDVYSKPEMRDGLRFARPPRRRRKITEPAVPAGPQKVVAATAGRAVRTLSVNLDEVGEGRTRRSTRSGSTGKKAKGR